MAKPNVIGIKSAKKKESKNPHVLLGSINEEIFEKLTEKDEKIAKETREQLKNECENGNAKYHYDEIVYIFNNFKQLDESQYKPSVKMGFDAQKFDSNCVNFINALSYFILNQLNDFTTSILFFSYKMKIDQDTEERKHYFDFNPDAFALLLYKRYYVDILKKSIAEDKSSTPYYFYDANDYKWRMVSDVFVSDRIKNNVRTLMNLLGFVGGMSKYRPHIAKEIMTSIEYLDDKGENALQKWTLNNPTLVQFKDTVYDIKNHSIAKMTSKFMPRHYHDYRLPIESVNLDELKVEDGFIPLTETIEDVEPKAQLVLERLQIITDEKPFMLTVFGNGFCHHNSFLTFPILEGGAGIGKSWFFELLSKNMFGQENISSSDQDDLAKDSDFILEGIYGSEFNLIGELNGNFMKQSFINTLKSKLSDSTEIKMKFRKPVFSHIHAQMLALSNKGQAPAIPDGYVNDDGIKRRIVRIACNEQKQPLDEKRFSRENLVEQLPSFAFLCMMTYKKHLDERKISEFTRNIGCTIKPIKGFTSQTMVDTTKDYFKKQDRKRKFFLSLYPTFVNRSKYFASDGYSDFPREAKLTSDDSRTDRLQKFKEWLKSLKVSEVDRLFKEYFDAKYRASNVNEDKLSEYLALYGIKQKRTTYKGKSIRSYGKEFVEFVESVFIDEEEGHLMLEEDI